jgi:hypothetical protein
MGRGAPSSGGGPARAVPVWGGGGTVPVARWCRRVTWANNRDPIVRGGRVVGEQGERGEAGIAARLLTGATSRG